MAKLKVYEYPHPILKKKAEPVMPEEFGSALREILDDMLETMYVEIGVGLAAPQVGISKRMIVIDYERDDEGNKPGNPMYLVNPEIVWKSEEKVCGTEGCLSVPEQRADVERFAAIKVKYQDVDGKENMIEADDFLAIVLQHEIDHLDGILYIDRISRLKRQMLVKKLEKMRKERAGE
ncbi:MAG: peptide deformylase [Alphaproteobacteria bacterium]|nr:peptide deformylase [Alphaproteobacteria bacterium]